MTGMRVLGVRLLWLVGALLLLLVAVLFAACGPSLADHLRMADHVRAAARACKLDGSRCPQAARCRDAAVPARDAVARARAAGARGRAEAALDSEAGTLLAAADAACAEFDARGGQDGGVR